MHGSIKLLASSVLLLSLNTIETFCDLVWQRMRNAVATPVSDLAFAVQDVRVLNGTTVGNEEIR